MNTEKQSNVVISTRVRLARNISGYPFPLRLSVKRAEEIAGEVYAALRETDAYSVYRIAGLKKAESEALKESHLISKELIARGERSSVVINQAQTVSVMLGEEDHVRAQCIRPDLSLEACYRQIDKVDDIISARLPYAFNEKLGYLTTCPTNLGTGMRASVMMFLPGLTSLNALEESISAVSRLNMTVRGVYGEGSQADGFIYQISNQISLGYSEAEILTMVETAATHLVKTEERARAILLERQGARLQDEILRAYGTALYAKLLSRDEMFRLTALIKLGVYYDLIKLKEEGALDRLITDMQPAILALKTGTAYGGDEGDAARADAVRETLSRVTSA